MMEIDWNLCKKWLSNDRILYTKLLDFEKTMSHDPRIIKLLMRGLAYVSQQDEAATLACCDEAQTHLGPSGSPELYPLYFFAAALPKTLNLLHSLSLPEDVIRETLMDFQRWLDVYRTNHGGSYGFNRQRWLLHHFCGHLVQLGRLQFQVGDFGFPFTFYISRIDGTLYCMAPSGLEIDDTGHLAGTNGVLSKTWTTTHTIINDVLTAHVVDPIGGIVLPQPIILNLSEIEILIEPHTPVLHIHIPAGGTLDDNEVSEAIRQARQFFGSWDVHEDIMVCDSWLLDSALAVFLPEDGNICKFMQRFAKFPVSHDRPQIYERVFGESFDPSLLSSWPCPTSLQKNLRTFLINGGKVYTTGGLLRER